MIYLEHTQGVQTAFIPRDGQHPEGQLHLRAVGTVDLAELLDTDVLDSGTLDQYFCISVELPDGCAEGEYEYVLTCDGLPVSTGIIYVGKMSPDDLYVGNPANGYKQFNKTIQYEQYQ